MNNINNKTNNLLTKSSFSIDSNAPISFKLNTRLRELRKTKHWSQSDLGFYLADFMNVKEPIPTSTVASWEHKNPNLAKIPSEDKIIALASLFSVSIDYLKGLSNDPDKSINEYIFDHSRLEKIAILPEELAQHMGEPIWVTTIDYDGWMFLTKNYIFIDDYGVSHNLQDLTRNKCTFSSFPPCHAYFNQVYSKSVIPETRIRFYKDPMWVCINSPDRSLQSLNGWYRKTPDGIGVVGKTILSYDSYFDFWLAYSSPLDEF